MPTRATDSRSEENHLSVENDKRGGQKGCKQPTSCKEEDAAIAWRGMGEGWRWGRVSENKSRYQVNKRKCEPARANQAGPRQRLGSVAMPLLFYFYFFLETINTSWCLQNSDVLFFPSGIWHTLSGWTAGRGAETDRRGLRWAQTNTPTGWHLLWDAAGTRAEEGCKNEVTAPNDQSATSCPRVCVCEWWVRWRRSAADNQEMIAQIEFRSDALRW